MYIEHCVPENKYISPIWVSSNTPAAMVSLFVVCVLLFLLFRFCTYTFRISFQTFAVAIAIGFTKIAAHNAQGTPSLYFSWPLKSTPTYIRSRIKVMQQQQQQLRKKQIKSTLI